MSIRDPYSEIICTQFICHWSFLIKLCSNDHRKKKKKSFNLDGNKNSQELVTFIVRSLSFLKEIFINFDRWKNYWDTNVNLCVRQRSTKMFIIVWIYYFKNYSLHQPVCKFYKYKSVLFSGLFLYVPGVVKGKYVFNWWKKNEHKRYVMSYCVHKAGLFVCIKWKSVTINWTSHEIMFPWNVSLYPEYGLSAII